MSALHRKWLSWLLGHCLIIVAAVCIGFPFFYMVTTSLKGIDEVYSVPLKRLPSRPMWENYLTAWNGVPFARFTLNTPHLYDRPGGHQVPLRPVVRFRFCPN